MAEAKFPLFKVHMPKEALENIKNVFDSGFINEGEQVTTLTDMLCDKLGSKRLVLLNSCTSALTLALKLAGVGPGDEVISTPMTCVATNTPIISLGAKIVWADIDPIDGMIDGSDVRKKITDKTKAIIAVAWAGNSPNLTMLYDMCKIRGIKLICDAAHAFGATYSGTPIASWADFTCFSFQAIKHFTTGDGGALICRSETDYKRSKALKWFGLDRDAAKDAQGNWKGQQWDVDIAETGFKFNMNNVQAAIGIAQIPYIDGLIEKHRSNASLYHTCFENYTKLVPAGHKSNDGSSFWVFTMLLKSDKITRDELLKRLNDEGIAAGVVHIPNDSYTCFKESITNLPGVREFSNCQLSLPCGWWLEDTDVVHIAQRVQAIINES